MNDYQVQPDGTITKTETIPQERIQNLRDELIGLREEALAQVARYDEEIATYDAVLGEAAKAKPAKAEASEAAP